MPFRRSPPRAPEHCYPALDDRVSARFVRLSSGLRVRLVEAGPTHGAPIVLLPGWAASAFTYRHQLPALGAAGWRATAVDLKGLGFSDKPTGPGEYTLEAMTRHVEEVVTGLGGGPAVIVGQSMAGRLALELGLRRPALVSRLVLVSPVGIGVVPFIRLARLLCQRVLDPIAPWVVRRWTVRIALGAAYGHASRVSEDAVEEYWAPAQFPGFARALRALVHDFDWSPMPASRLSGLMVPTLLVRATLDRLVRGPPKRSVAGLDRMRLVVVDDAGHAVNEESPDPVNAAILAYLGHVGASGS